MSDSKQDQGQTEHHAGGVVIKDSGKRQEFSTGARRDIQDGKGRYDLLPMHAIERVAKIYEGGAIKYGEDNYRKGIPLRRFADSALRHLCKAVQGQSDEDHFAMAAWNIMSMMETKFMIDQGLLPKELDNLPNWHHKTEEKTEDLRKCVRIGGCLHELFKDDKNVTCRCDEHPISCGCRECKILREKD